METFQFQNTLNLNVCKKHFRSEYCIAISILIDVLNKLFDVQNKNKMTGIWMFKILRFCIQTSKLFFYSPDLQGYVSYCNDLASLIHKLFIFQPSSEDALNGLKHNLTEMFLTRFWTSVILMQVYGQAWYTGHNSFWLGNISMIFLRTV